MSKDFQQTKVSLKNVSFPGLLKCLTQNKIGYTSFPTAQGRILGDCPEFLLSPHQLDAGRSCRIPWDLVQSRTSPSPQANMPCHCLQVLCETNILSPPPRTSFQRASSALVTCSCRQCFIQEAAITSNISSRAFYQRTGMGAILTTILLCWNVAVYDVVSAKARPVSMCTPQFIHSRGAALCICSQNGVDNTPMFGYC